MTSNSSDRKTKLDDMLRKLDGETRKQEPDEFGGCDHGVAFDEDAAKGLSAEETRKRWPRMFGACPKGCGFNGIAYASFGHYIMGDW